jgi:hypothetical protein
LLSAPRPFSRFVPSRSTRIGVFPAIMFVSRTAEITLGCQVE